MLKIEGTGNLCLPRSVVTALARLAKDTDEGAKNFWDTISRGDKHRNTLQLREAKALVQRAGLGAHKGPMGIPEINAIQVRFLLFYVVVPTIIEDIAGCSR